MSAEPCAGLRAVGVSRADVRSYSAFLNSLLSRCKCRVKFQSSSGKVTFQNTNHIYCLLWIFEASFALSYSNLQNLRHDFFDHLASRGNLISQVVVKYLANRSGCMVISTSHRLFSGQTFIILIILAAAFGVFSIALNGCGSSTRISGALMNPSATKSLAFVSNSGSGTVAAFTINASGALTPVSGSPFSAGAGAEFMAFDSVHNLLFVSNQNANSLSVFSVNTSTGMLTTVPGSPFTAGSRPTGVAVAPTAGLVFVGNQNDSTVSIFAINSMTGSLTPVAGSPVAGIANPFGLTVNPAGTVLFVNNFRDDSTGGANAVSAFQINAASSSLTPVGAPFATSSPAGITTPVGLATDGKQVFVGNHMAESVVSLQVSGSGMLTTASSLPSPGASCNSSCHNNPLRLTIDPMDKFVFATNVAAGTVSTFSINSGSLSLMSTAGTGQHPFGVATDPSGAFLYVVNKVDNSISGFSLSSGSGMLLPLSGFPFSKGSLSAPTDIVIIKSTAM